MSEFNPFELQNLTWERSDISIGAKSMMNRLRNAAGRKGKISYESRNGESGLALKRGWLNIIFPN